MRLAVIVQMIVFSAGISGIYFVDEPKMKPLFALFITLGTIAALAVAWNEKKSADFIKRALENLVRSTQLNDLARSRVLEAFSSAGAVTTLENMKVLGFSGGFNFLKFSPKDGDIEKVLALKDATLASIAIEPDNSLVERAGSFFRAPASSDARSWNDIVECIGMVGKICLWEHQIETPAYAVWANAEEGTIAIPVVPPDASATSDQRISFTVDAIAEMGAMSDIDLHTTVYALVNTKLRSDA